MNEELMRVVDEQIRPVLKSHYGDIEVLSFEDGIFRFRLLGQCCNCPSAEFTAKDIIEEPLRAKFPQLKEVVLENGVSDELISFAKELLNKNK